MNNLKDKPGKLIILGSGGHSRPVIDIAQQLGYEILGIIDPHFSGKAEQITGVKVLGDESVLADFGSDISVFIAIGNNNDRAKWFQELEMKYAIPNLIHPTAIVSQHVKMGKGVLVNAGAIVNSESIIENGSIINTGVIVDHESKIGNFVHLAPGVSLAGRVEIGALSFIGIGTSVIDKIKVGEKVVIGANSTIIKDIPSNAKVIGVSKLM